MDIIIIGKKHHNRQIKPHVIYCGQSRDEAAAAVAATEGRFAYLYQVNPEPMIPVRTPAPSGKFLEELNAKKDQEAKEAAEAEAKRQAELQALADAEAAQHAADKSPAVVNPPAEVVNSNAGTVNNDKDSAGADSPDGDEPASDLTEAPAQDAPAPTTEKAKGRRKNK